MITLFSVMKLTPTWSVSSCHTLFACPFMRKYIVHFLDTGTNLLTFRHNNAGPKFGIKLLSNETCRTVQSLKLEDMMASEDLLHIPTPWHNCVVKIENHRTFYVVKSKVAFNAINCGDYQGEWINGGDGIGGYYALRANSMNTKEFATGTTTEQKTDPVLDSGKRVPLSYGFFVPPTFIPSDVAEVMEVVGVLDTKYKGIKIHFIGLDMNPVTKAGVIPTCTIHDCPQLDVFIVAGIPGNILDKSMHDFIKETAAKTQFVLGAEGGTIVLAKAGALAGKKVASKVLLRGTGSVLIDTENEKEWVQDGGIFTSSSKAGTLGALSSFLSENFPVGESHAINASLC